MIKKLLQLCVVFVSLTFFGQHNAAHYTVIADSLDHTGNHTEALGYRQKALDAHDSGADLSANLLEALYRYTASEIEFSQPKGNYSEAYENLEEAVETIKTTGEHPQVLPRHYYRLATHAFDFLYNQETAAKYLDQAFEYFDRAKDKDTILLLEMKEFSSYSKIMAQQYHRAIEEAKDGLEIIAAYNRDTEEIKTLKSKFYYDLGLIHNFRFLDIPLKEYQYNVEAERILTSMENPDLQQLVLTYRSLAMFERENKNYAKGLRYLDKAFTLYEKNKESIRKLAGFKTELALYRVYIVLLLESGAEKKLIESIATVETLYENNTFDAIEKGNYRGFLNFISQYYLKANQLDLASEYITKASNIKIDMSRAPYSLTSFIQSTEINHIELLIKEEKFEEAAKLIEITIRNEAEINLRLYPIKADVYLALRDYDTAMDAINSYFITIDPKNASFAFPNDSLDDFNPGHSIAQAEYFIALASSFRKYYGKISKEEEQLYWMALRLFGNNLKEVSLNKDLKIVYDKIISGLMDAAIQRKFTASESSRLLSFMESITSRELINKFMLKRDIAQNTAPYKLIEDEQYLRSYITFLKKEYQRNESESIKTEIFEKERELDDITRDILKTYRNNNPLIEPEIDVLKAPKDKNIIKFKVADDQLYRIAFIDGTLSYEYIDGYKDLRPEIESFLQNLTHLEVSLEHLKQEGEKLYAQLLGDILDPDTPTLIIPDDILYFLPFDLLTHKGRYLIEDHIISYDQNMFFTFSNNGDQPTEKTYRQSVFFAPEYDGTVKESVIAVRDNTYSLSGALDEVREIASKIPGKTFMGEEASKTNFKSLDGDYSILHLAMHSNLDDTDSELSHLVFSNTESDYKMYISELYGMNFNIDLAVLSACNTGIGGFKNGENLISMHHTFTTAGISATVASLWNAPDQATKEIMVAFYDNLKQNQDKASALRNAKLDYLKNAKDASLKHPFFWAGFVLSGDDAPIAIYEPPFWKHSGFVFGLIILFLLVIALYFVRSKAKRN